MSNNRGELLILEAHLRKHISELPEGTRRTLGILKSDPREERHSHLALSTTSLHVDENKNGFFPRGLQQDTREMRGISGLMAQVTSAGDSNEWEKLYTMLGGRRP